MDAAGTTGGRVLRNVAFRSVAELGAKLSSVALFTVMGRTVGDEGVGLYSFALSMGALASTLADFGQDKVLTREVARYPDAVSRYYANTMALRLVVGLPLLAVAVLLVPAFGYGRDAQLALLFVGGAVLVDLLTATTLAVFQAFERVALLSGVLLAERWVLAVGGIAALLAGASVVAVGAVFLAGAVGALALASVLLRRATPVRWELDPRSWWPLMRAAAPLGVAGLFGTVLFRVDTAMLAAFTAADVVGNYGAAYRLFETTLFVSWSVNTAFFPVFSRLARGDRAEAARTFEQAVKVAVLAVLPVATGFAVLAGPVVRVVFGADFEAAPDALLLLAPAVACYPVSYLGGYLAVSHDRERTLTALYGAVAAGNIALNLVLIPAYSLRGAAVSTSVSEAVALVGVLAIVRRAVGSLDWGRVAGSAALGAAVAAATMAVLRHVPALAVVGGAVAYLAVVVTRERRRHPADLAAFRQVVTGAS